MTPLSVLLSRSSVTEGALWGGAGGWAGAGVAAGVGTGGCEGACATDCSKKGGSTSFSSPTCTVTLISTMGEKPVFSTESTSCSAGGTLLNVNVPSLLEVCVCENAVLA